MSKLKNVAAKYKFESDKEMEERLVDQLIWGSCHPDVQKKLIGRYEKLTLKDAIDVARSFEATNKQMRLLASNQDYSSPKKSVNTIKKYSKPRSYKPQQQTKICNNCGKTHDISARKNCPAYRSQCHKCGKMNHWQSVCKSSKKIQNRPPTQRSNRQQIHDVGYNTDMTEEETLTIGTIHEDDNREEVYTILQIERAEVTQKINLKCKVDTGAQSNVVPLRLFRIIFPDKIDSKGNPKPNALQGTNMILSAYGGSQIKQLGTITIPCQHRGRKINCIFYVTDATGPAILGPKVPPVVHAARRIPIDLRDRLKTELTEMKNKNIITKVNQPTDWVNSLVIREKENGRLRLCLDPKDLNTAIKWEHHPTPTLEDITHKLTGAKLFSKLDARNGYWNVKLDEESSVLTTINTPFGRYRFLRMPFGLRMIQDVFQFKVDEAYRNCKGAIGIADDIQVYGSNETDHDLHLHEAMEDTRRAGIKLNRDKCHIKSRECSFYGMIYTAEGVKPSLDKVRAVEMMQPPNDKKELRTFLGLVTYMGPFIPKLSDHTALLRELIKDNSEFVWTPTHTKSFDNTRLL
ncbi:uncharacterized protein LOC100366641 [Saccoglossus kowalevskii]|uniref:Uncharacterized protein K02A2.6-like n=1 Tax=Saccoglossus kowalevskii TaxID=10224 RepID=A0ABM0LV57_SACKO|nr:PREDICTED: uncharacterized protein K02A2.6-like [Saccoglossus kowalevskii]